MSILSKAYFHDEAAAFDHVESIVWGDKPACPHCGHDERIYKLEGVRSKPSKKNPQGVLRHGLKKCGSCRKQFTVRVKTVFESSHVPLHKWLQAAYLMMSSKKGISSKQLERTLEVTYKTAWFMAHRLREAMREGALDVPFGSGGGVVEADETFIGQDPDAKTEVKRRNWVQRNKVLSVVDRERGQVRSCVINDLRATTIIPMVLENVSREARLLTDDAPRMKTVGYQFAKHDRVNHTQKEYVNVTDRTIHTNTIEGYFSIFKRGMKGVYQHCSKKHLHRYLAEFDFRYNNRERLGVNDMERTEAALQGIVGKRLTYRGPSGRRA